MRSRMKAYLKKSGEGQGKPAARDPEDASTGMIAYLVIAVFAGLFFYIGTGYIVDDLIAFYNSFISVTSIPISQDTSDTMEFMVLVFRAIPFLGIIMPLVVYGIFVSLRERNSVV